MCITHFLSDQLIFWGLARMWLIYYENNCYSWEHIKWEYIFWCNIFWIGFKLQSRTLRVSSSHHSQNLEEWFQHTMTIFNSWYLQDKNTNFAFSAPILIYYCMFSVPSSFLRFLLDANLQSSFLRLDLLWVIETISWHLHRNPFFIFS